MNMWLIFAFLSSITAALVAIFGKIGLRGADPTLAATIRSIIMAIFLAVVSFSLNKFQDFSLKSFSSKDWILIILAGVASALSWLFYFLALKTGLATKVVAIDRLSLIFVIILASVFLGEQLGWKVIIGALLMIAGAITITLK
ncbi:MAG: EamA family transporter [Candidatus Pacebacteria bacterium]|nr:EamA family transporter [Candidatus Paceibacterota bacterium]